MLFLVAGCQVEASVLSILEVVLLGSVLERSKPAGSCSHTKQSTSVFSRRPKGRADYILRPEHGADEQQSLPRQREAALHPSQHTRLGLLLLPSTKGTHGHLLLRRPRALDGPRLSPRQSVNGTRGPLHLVRALQAAPAATRTLSCRLPWSRAPWRPPSKRA